MTTAGIEWRWIKAFARTFELCAVSPGDEVAIVSETTSRRINVDLAELALLSMDARPFHVVLPSPEPKTSIPIQSTGSTTALNGRDQVVRALSSSGLLVVDLTVEGMLHAPQTKQILSSGARVLYISNEHPEILARLLPSPSLEPKIRAGQDMLRAASVMRFTSAAGTDLTVKMDGAIVGGGWGYCRDPGSISHWPGGLIACVPKRGSVDGTIVMAPGDINLTFKRFLETPVTLRVENDYVRSIEGDGLDAELMRSYYAAWDDPEAYATSHVGWGMNPAARWETFVLYDGEQTNGTEQRAFAGNFLYSTGGNGKANRFTDCHFDLPIRGCSVHLDNTLIVDAGRIVHPALV